MGRTLDEPMLRELRRCCADWIRPRFTRRSPLDEGEQVGVDAVLFRRRDSV
jgi:hypothetical protein